MEDFTHLIAVAKGEVPADLLIKNVQVVNVFIGKVFTSNVALAGKYIAGIGNYQTGKRIIDAQNLYLIPGLMDAHIHLESTLLTPSAFARAVIPHGTTSIFIDPHEIANVLGIKGINYMLKATQNLPLNVFVLAPSCVPATNLETSGASITAEQIAKLLQHPRVVGLAEMMNFPGVINADKTVLAKIRATHEAKKIIDGHAPLLRGKMLQAYIGVSIDSDHETTQLDEAIEKLGAGMWLMLRQGTAAKNLLTLLPAVNSFTVHRCLLCCDDKEPTDLQKQGHIDHLIKLAIKAGINPIWAIKMATINCAQRFGIKRLGAIAPGYRADLILVKNLSDFEIETVIKDGEVIFEEGTLKVSLSPYIQPEVTNTVHLKDISPDDFRIFVQGEKVRIIGLLPDQIITKHLIKEAKKEGDEILADPEQDTIKIAVIERHHATGNMGLGLLSGLGLKRGAIASSVSHDSHNIVVAGVNNQDMYCAVKAIEKMQGGFVLVENEVVKAGLALPIAGLISPLSAQGVGFHMKTLCQEAKNLGISLPNPFLTLSFVALPVIPELRLTDKGLVDVNQFKFVALQL